MNGNEVFIYALRWIICLVAAFFAGKAIAKVKMPQILGWLIAGMLLGPNAAGLMPQAAMDAQWYKAIITWMQCGFGVMLGVELVWRRIRSYGKALMITTLTQSLGTFAVVTLVFAVVFKIRGLPIYLAFAFGGIALATAPAPALSIVNEFHAHGPVTDTLLPMTVLDDIVGIAVFFTVQSFISREVSGGSIPLYMIPVMIFLPILIGVAVGIAAGFILRKKPGRAGTLAVVLVGITVTVLIGVRVNASMPQGASMNFTLLGVAFSAAFSNMIGDRQLDDLTKWFSPILGVCLICSIFDLGAPLDYHLIASAGLYTVLYIAARAFGKYFGARAGATATGLPETVQKYLGLTLLPHSGVSLVFTGIICNVLQPTEPALAAVVKGTIAAAAVINEIIAVIAAKRGFELAGEIDTKKPSTV
jgi:Kef-type K+ transport system membrane component KefB